MRAHYCGKSKLADVLAAETDTQEAGIAPAAAAAAELSCASDAPTTPESQDLPSEKSDEEQDLSAMEVE